MQGKAPALSSKEAIMFVVVRSVFWLTAAYMGIKPAVDLPDTGAMAAQAMAAGKQVVAEQVSNIECNSFECIGGKAVAAAVLQPTLAVVPPLPSTPMDNIPYPRPRLERAS